MCTLGEPSPQSTFSAVPAPATKRRKARRPQLERDTPLVAMPAAQTVVEEASLHLGTPLPERLATRIAHQARRTFAHSAQFRILVGAKGDRGRDLLYVFMRHWLAARLLEDLPDLYSRLPSGFANGVALSGRTRLVPAALLSAEGH